MAAITSRIKYRGDLENSGYDTLTRAGTQTERLSQAMIENCYMWTDKTDWFEEPAARLRSPSGTLFDTVAINLAISDDLCPMETLPIRVKDHSMTVVDPAGKTTRVATTWHDLEAFEDWLVERLTQSAQV